MVAGEAVRFTGHGGALAVRIAVRVTEGLAVRIAVRVAEDLAVCVAV